MAQGATAQKKRPSRPQIVSKAKWAGLAVHTVTLPSGAVVRIKIPDLSLLLAGGAVPDRLRTVALRQLTEDIRDAQASPAAVDAPPIEIDEEHLVGLAELTRWLVAQTLVEPEVTEVEIEDGIVPNEDILMLTQFASRERTVDAAGMRLGVEPIDRWEVWRGFHGCPDDCEHCSAAVEALTTRG